MGTRDNTALLELGLFTRLQRWKESSTVGVYDPLLLTHGTTGAIGYRQWAGWKADDLGQIIVMDRVRPIGHDIQQYSLNITLNNSLYLL